MRPGSVSLVVAALLVTASTAYASRCRYRFEEGTSANKHWRVGPSTVDLDGIGFTTTALFLEWSEQKKDYVEKTRRNLTELSSKAFDYGVAHHLEAYVPDDGEHVVLVDPVEGVFVYKSDLTLVKMVDGQDLLDEKGRALRQEQARARANTSLCHEKGEWKETWAGGVELSKDSKTVSIRTLGGRLVSITLEDGSVPK